MKKFRKVFAWFMVGLALVTIPSCGVDKIREEISLIPFYEEGEDGKGKWGVVNRQGEEVIKPKFEQIPSFFREGFSIIHRNGEANYINEEGELATTKTYEQANLFNEGLAFVAQKDGVIECINQSFETVFTLPQALEVMPFSEGLARFQSAEGKFGFVDREGKEIVPAQYAYATDFSDGWACVTKINDKREVSRIYINKEGNEVLALPSNITYASGFGDGIAMIQRDEKYGFINKDGDIVLEPTYQHLTHFYEGYASFSDDGEYWGLINKKGEKVIRAKYASGLEVKEGMVFADLGEGKGYILLEIGEEKPINITPYQKVLLNFADGVALVKEGSNYIFINKKGEMLYNKEYKQIDILGRNSGVLNSKVDINVLAKKFVADNFDPFNKQTTIDSCMNYWGVSSSEKENIEKSIYSLGSNGWRRNFANDSYKGLSSVLYIFDGDITYKDRETKKLYYNSQAHLRDIEYKLSLDWVMRGKEVELARAIARALGSENDSTNPFNKNAYIPLIKNKQGFGSISIKSYPYSDEKTIKIEVSVGNK